MYTPRILSTVTSSRKIFSSEPAGEPIGSMPLISVLRCVTVIRKPGCTYGRNHNGPRNPRHLFHVTIALLGKNRVFFVNEKLLGFDCQNTIVDSYLCLSTHSYREHKYLTGTPRYARSITISALNRVDETTWSL